MMGRPIKPLGLHRKAISISLPLDVIGWLDNMVLKANKKAGRSKVIELALRNAMTKGQTTLSIENEEHTRYVWECSKCHRSFHVAKLSEVMKCKCGFWLDKKTDYRGIFEEEEE